MRHAGAMTEMAIRCASLLGACYRFQVPLFVALILVGL